MKRVKLKIPQQLYSWTMRTTVLNITFIKKKKYVNSSQNCTEN